MEAIQETVSDVLTLFVTGFRLLNGSEKQLIRSENKNTGVCLN
jgi:hypothetical protein